MNIAVYSGSFNPLHIGHLAIMEYLTRDAGFDGVYLVVAVYDGVRNQRQHTDAHSGSEVCEGSGSEAFHID